jgi:thiol:disulfide interchange protein DsbD
MKKWILLVLLSVPFLGFSQVLKPAEWNNSLSKTAPKAGDEIEILFEATIDPEWYLYSSDFDPDLGPMVTEFTFAENDTYELIGKIEPVNPKKGYDEIFEGDYTYFKDKGLFKQKVKILQDEYEIKGSYSYQVCSDITGQCIPFDEEFSFGAPKKKQ